MDRIDSILQQWQRERPDLDVAPMGTFGRLKRLDKHVTRRLERVFESFDLTPADFDVLATLRRSGPPYALTPSSLIEWTMVTSGTMTHRVDRLQRAGYVARIKNPEDGRGFRITLTSAGHTLIDEAVTHHVDNQHELIAPLDAEERAELDRLLGKWLAAFDA